MIFSPLATIIALMRRRANPLILAIALASVVFLVTVYAIYSFMQPHPYTIKLSSKMSQIPILFYPQTKYSSDGHIAFLGIGIVPIVFESDQTPQCTMLKAKGILKNAPFTDFSGKTHGIYHLFATDFVCIK